MGPSILHTSTLLQPATAINRLHMFFHCGAVVALLYYRLTHLLLFRDVPTLPWSLMTLSELILAVTWLLQQPFRWRPVVREVYPENIPVPESDLPRVDVFVCTADPKKEPVFDVMNTVVSAMSLDYPPEKLAVYISDDGGAPLTLYSVKQARDFVRSWVPFVRKYRIKSICPQAFFSRMGDEERLLRSGSEFQEDEKQIKTLYEQFKRKVEKAAEPGEIGDATVGDRPPHVEVFQDSKTDPSDDNSKLPLLVYVSRERRPSYPHRFKAGALNALLRVSGLISNAPYLLVLDCDMFCNEPATARQALCFHLDEKAFPTLAFVQFPQVFHNLGKDDIYAGEGRTTYKSQWHGMDGLRGPLLSGTGYYMKRKVLFGNPNEEGVVKEDEKDTNLDLSSDDVLEKAKTLATCAFEKNTNWGKEIGFSYGSLLESSFTGYLLHCRGWTSVYYYPKRPGFLGCAPSDLKDASGQMLKWISGLLQVGLSKVNPITYGMANMSVSQCMCYGYFMYICLYTIALGLYGSVPQVYFVKGVPLYPKVSDPWFAVFVIVKASSIFEQLYEVLRTGGTTKACWNEYRMWLIQSISGLLFGVFDAISSILGLSKTTFRLSNKVVDEDKLKKSEKGKFDFQGAGKFIIPLAAYVLLTIVCFIGGVKRMVLEKNYEDMFGQFLLSSLLTYVTYSIIEGLVSMKR